MDATFRTETLAGLAVTPRTLPCKYFYDQVGSRLFDQICGLPEYYLTRSEQALLETHRDDIVAAITDRPVLVELGSGSSIKTRLLLDALPRLCRYVPIDISEAHLLETADGLRARYPALVIDPVVGDYSQAIPTVPGLDGARATVFFPGSSLGNFHPGGAIRLLTQMRRLAGPGGTILLGLDPGRDVPAIVRAYNDAAGVTAAFNLNLLARINRELGGTFDLARFRHEAVWQEGPRRVEMRLVSLTRQTVRIGERTVELERDEPIVTEHCYKYADAALASVAGAAELVIARTWTEPTHGMQLHQLIAA